MPSKNVEKPIRAIVSVPMLLLITLLCDTALGQGGGLILYETGTPHNGRSQAGASAVADDASTAWYNPAGMTRLKKNALLVGAQPFYLNTRFDSSANTTTLGGDGGNAGGVFPAAGFYYVHVLSDEARLGFTFNSFFGLGINYKDNWAGRYTVQDTSLTTLNFNPSFAYRLNDWLSLGAGVMFLLGKYEQEAALFNVTQPYDGKYEIQDADDWTVAFNLGAHIEPREETRIGVTYRSEADFDLTGDIRFTNLGPILGSKLFDSNFSAELKLPQGINVGLYHELSPQFAFLADAGWTDWSSFSSQTLNVGQLDRDIDRKWKDTWHAGMGCQYWLDPVWLLETGYAFDSSPVSSSDRTPDLPVDEQHRFSVGARHYLSENSTIGLAYTYAYLGKARIKNHQLGNVPVILDGDYEKNEAHFLTLTYAYRF